MNDVESSTLHSIPRSFQQYSAYMFTSYNEQYLVNVIFNSTMCTLFRLHDPEMDYIFRVRTKNLQKILFKRLLAKQTDLAQKIISLKKHFCAKESIKYNQHKRSNSNELDKVLDYRIQHEMFTFHQDRINTYRDGDYNQSHFILEFRRQNALNQFGKEYCTYFIQHNLQDMVLEVKDSMNLFYNRIETHIDEDDQKHNILSHKFGFKSKLIIPHKNSNQIFEVYLPILVQKGKRKINKKQSKKEQNEKTFAIYGLMMDPGIVTDDSIKDITLDDIKSSDNESIRKNSNTPHQHHHHGFKKVPPVEGSALDHYKKLRVEREKQASKKNHHHRRPSKRSTPQSTISKAKKHACNQHPTKDKFFLVEDQENIIQDFNFKYKKNYSIQTQNVVNQIMHQVEDDYIKQYQKQQEILDKIKVAKVKFLARIRPENKSMQHFEFQQLNRRETEISYQRERLIKNINVNYNFDVVRKNEMQQNPDRKQYRSQSLKMSQSKAGFKQYMDLKQAIVDAEGQYRQELKNSKSMSSRKVAFEVFKKRYNKIKNLGKDESDLELENELEIFQQSKLRRKEYQKQMERKKIKLETLKKNKRKQFKSEKRSELEQSVKKLEPKYLKYDDIITKISLKILEIQQAHMERVDGCSGHDNLEKEEMKQKIKDLKLDYKKRHHKLEAGESSAGVIIDNQAKLSKQRTQYFISKMFNAVNCKNVKRMEEILRRFTQGTKENEHMFDSQGNSLVALAVINSDQEMVHLLLSRGMKANTQNLDGDTPLHYAVNSGQSKIVDILISHGADEKIVNHQGLTPWEINP